jgi:ribonuclease P protein component
MYFSVTPAEAKTINAIATSARSPSISIKYLPGDYYKYTVVLSKKQGNSVKRNRIKRIIREIMRNKRGEYPEGLYLIYFKKKCDHFNRKTIQNNIDTLIKNISPS